MDGITGRGTSSRQRSRATGRFIRETPGSRSLERGLALLRAFRQGGPALTNADLAERVGLPRPTVSRLTRSLVDSGFLSFDFEQRAYRLTPVYLSLALVYRDDFPELDLALPAMRAVAEGEEINVGLAVPDQHDMVYLASVRRGRRGLFRRIVPGSRRPIETTSLGLCYLDALDASSRARLLGHIESKYPDTDTTVMARIARSRSELASLGYCLADWHDGMVAMATSLAAPDRSIYALNVSFSSPNPASTARQAARYGPMLLDLAKTISAAWLARAQERQGA
ncbi:MAG: helix-turn-helix domain-containing protein [Burkholderiaceae bacterium]|jgi:DNA-binding IclR family transcriptional regulator|nr:helix-turn-helix domain-containing protein [Gemmatimonadales bacterium]MCO5121657.1 helix-turn-helix domain-containing protein [Burkholderiaceae bacterium]MEB2319231.1 helix-turn-helix domain-containing protein [Pseudomonadota bacterium]